MMTSVLSATPEAIHQAAECLRRGGLVAFPTETVYGLGAAAENPTAVQRMFATKGRPADHPVIVHLAQAGQLDDWAIDIPPQARQLALAFWPGPLTIILRRNPRVSRLVTGGLATVGLRVPGHTIARQLLREFGGGIAAPSANRFGRVSPTRAEQVQTELGGLVDLILDGGPCQVGLESTIVDLSQGEPAVLRPGAITAEQLERVLGKHPARAQAHSPRVSGSMTSHYAPQAQVEVLSDEQISLRAKELAAQGLTVAVLLNEPFRDSLPQSVVTISIPRDEAKFAQELYSLLRRVDELRCDVVLTTLPREEGIGVAIADRLRRAAGQRDGD